MSSGVTLPSDLFTTGSAGSSGLNIPNMYQPPAVFQQVQNEMNNSTGSQNRSVGIDLGLKLQTPNQSFHQTSPQYLPGMGQPTVQSYGQSQQFTQVSANPGFTTASVQRSSPVVHNPVYSQNFAHQQSPSTTYSSMQPTYLNQQVQQPTQLIQTAPQSPSGAMVVNEPILRQYKSGWLVIGNTIAYKEHFKSLGGKFGKNYKGISGEDLVGWYFSNDKYQNLLQLLEQIKGHVIQPAAQPVYRTQASPSKDSNMQKLTIMVKRPKPSDLFFMISGNTEKKLTLQNATEEAGVVSQLTLREEGGVVDLYAVPVNINGQSIWLILSAQNTWSVLDIRSPSPTLPLFNSSTGAPTIGSTINSTGSSTNSCTIIPDQVREKYPQTGNPSTEGVVGAGTLDQISSFS